MSVWVINLIDNRKHDADKQEKFRQCKNMGILAIGWAHENPLSFYKDDDLRAYAAAVKGLSSIQPADLVWVHDTANKAYYICKVYGALENAPKSLWSKDIGRYRQAEWYGPISQNALPYPLAVQRLISRPTIRRVLKPDVIRATQTLFDSTLVHNKIILEAIE